MMTPTAAKDWKPAGSYQGIFRQFLINAARHKDEQGRSVWLVRVYPKNSGHRHRSYWIEGGRFYRIATSRDESYNEVSVATLTELEDISTSERLAVHEALVQWEIYNLTSKTLANPSHSGDPDGLSIMSTRGLLHCGSIYKNMEAAFEILCKMSYIVVDRLWYSNCNGKRHSMMMSRVLSAEPPW